LRERRNRERRKRREQRMNKRWLYVVMGSVLALGVQTTSAQEPLPVLPWGRSSPDLAVP
jgi:hypothetical protein